MRIWFRKTAKDSKTRPPLSPGQKIVVTKTYHRNYRKPGGSLANRSTKIYDECPDHLPGLSSRKRYPEEIENIPC